LRSRRPAHQKQRWPGSLVTSPNLHAAVPWRSNVRQGVSPWAVPFRRFEDADCPGNGPIRDWAMQRETSELGGHDTRPTKREPGASHHTRKWPRGSARCVLAPKLPEASEGNIHGQHRAVASISSRPPSSLAWRVLAGRQRNPRHGTFDETGQKR
jgi:hypothetical protein